MNDPVGEVLYERRAAFRHASQLRDFTAYCKKGAILSRERLSGSVPYYTRFYSDEIDKRHGVWSRTFGNLQDFGGLFWFSENGIPNAYGPITVTFGREVWKHCKDVAVTKTNAGDKDFDLAKDRMSSAAVADCFTKTGNSWTLTEYGLELSVENLELSLELATRVTVEPIYDELFQTVVCLWRSAGLDPGKVRVRNIQNARAPRAMTFQQLVEWARNAKGELPEFRKLGSVVPNDLRGWFNEVKKSHHPPLRQWLVYTYAGTLSHFEQ